MTFASPTSRGGGSSRPTLLEIAINNLHYIVFDFETGGLKPDYHEAIQIAGKAYHARTLEPFPLPGGEFSSLMKPLYPERLQDEALALNKKTREQVLAAPDQKLVWNQFVDWVAQYRNPNENFGGLPIACGKNIRNFDMKFVEVLNRLHLKKNVRLFSRNEVDLEDFVFHWFENSDELPNIKMDTLRDYFAMSKEGAHDALVDVRQTGALIMKFLNVCRTLRSRTREDGSKLIKFQGAFAKAAA